MSQPPSPWPALRRFTPARIGLGRAGNGLPTAAHLAFQAAHALARDAVHAALDVAAVQRDLQATGIPSRAVRSTCPDRASFLLRPDLGRRLDPADAAALAADMRPGCFAIVLADGLSAGAAGRHGVELVRLLAAPVGPCAVVVATQARVALGDEVGAALGAQAALVLIGERPGLSASDSLGAYLTWAPRIGRSDAERNCVSNIRPEGMPLRQAADKLLWLIAEMRRRQLTGVGLKDEQVTALEDASGAVELPGG